MTSSEHEPSDPTLPGIDEDLDTSSDGGYTAERPVNLREQKLLPTAPSTGGPAMRLRPGLRPPTGAARIRDKYNVGPQNLAAPTLSTADLEVLREEHMRRVVGEPPGVEVDPATWGWRGKANALGARFKATPDEIDYRLAVESIQQPLPGTPIIAVINPKGGAGTTPAALLLSNIFGRYRGHGVIAWDNNEARGTLAARAARAPRVVPTTWDLLEHAEQLCSGNVVASALGRFVIPQPSGDEVLASDQSSKRVDMIGSDECAAIMAVLRRHRTMVVVDTPSNDRSPAFVWTVEHATQLVIPLTYRRDAAHMLLRSLDGLIARGHSELVRNAVVVLAEGTAADSAVRDAVQNALARAEVTRLTHVPFDADLAGGDRIVLSRLSEATVRAWTHVAAVVADGVGEVLAAMDTPLQTTFVPESRTAPSEYDVRARDRGAGGQRAHLRRPSTRARGDQEAAG